MAVKESNTRIIATISKELKEKLDELCIKDKRKISQEVEYILEQYIKNLEENK